MKKIIITTIIIALIVAGLYYGGVFSILDDPYIIHEYTLSDTNAPYYYSNLGWRPNNVGPMQSAAHIGDGVLDQNNIFQIKISAESKPSQDDNGNLYVWFDPICTLQYNNEYGSVYRCIGGKNYLVGYVQGDTPTVYRSVSSTYPFTYQDFTNVAFYSNTEYDITHSVRNVKVTLYEAVECTDNTHCLAGRNCDVTRYVCVDDTPPIVIGCTDPEANNYNPNANQGDGSCTYDPGQEPKTGFFNGIKTFFQNIWSWIKSLFTS